MTATVVTDGRRVRGDATRRAILARSMQLASSGGLEALSIAQLANDLGMSKSGLFAHFGSKEELQLAAIDAAREIFIARVVEPARAAERGLPRLRALLDAKLAYLRGEAFRGGCFFDAARTEYDSRPAGPVRDAIVKQTDDWLEHLSARIRSAQEEGHIDPDIEPEQLAFEVDALQSAANVSYQLRRDAAVFDRVQRAIEARLGSITLPPPPAARPRARRGPARDRRARS
jgi:AcrR family transcriptional regulator